MMQTRNYTGLDRVIASVDKRLKNIAKTSIPAESRKYPAADLPATELSDEQRRHVAGLMRVNHAGEIAAQALYKAQALTAKDNNIKAAMRQSAEEEYDHLRWCEQRLRELDDHPSMLKPVWSAGSFAIGLVAGSFGDKWNLGFLAETENQVASHLDEHLQRLPAHDTRSRIIIEQMREDEQQHADSAVAAGASELPGPVKRLMSLASMVMKKTAYRL